MIVLLWFVNFIISWANAWGVGKTWTETKAVGGPAHFMSWMGAIMASVGFTWCYMVILGVVAMNVPETMISDDGDPNVMLLDQESASVFFDLVYLVIIFPLVGSGMAITTHSWGVFWRRRSLTNGVTAGWNTYAQIHNFYSAVQHVPRALDNVGGFFGGGSSSSSNKDGKGLVIIVLAVVAVAGGILTTWAIIRHTARETARSRRHYYENLAEERQAEAR